MFFDATNQRWFLSSAAFNLSLGTQIYLAVSQTPDPTGAWTVYPPVVQATGTLMDQPKLGDSDNTVILAWDDYTNCTPSSCPFKGDEVWVIDKHAVLAGAALGFSNTRHFGFFSPSDPNYDVFAARPAHALSSTANGFLVFNENDDRTSTNAIGLLSITGSFTTTISLVRTNINTNQTLPPPAAQEPGSATLDTGDDRMSTAVWKNGTLWSAATGNCVTHGGSCVLVWPLSTGSPPSFLSWILIDQVSTPVTFLYYPALSLDSSGNMLAVFTESSSAMYPSVAMGGQAVGAFGPTGPTVIVPGTAAYDFRVCNGVALSRWGDYSGAAIDPTDPNSVWVAAEYAAGSELCDFRTAIGQISFSAPAPVQSFTFSPSPIAGPGSLSPSQQVTVTLSGAAPGGTVWLSFQQALSGGSAAVGSTALTGSPQAFVADGSGHVNILYKAPGSLPASGRDVIRASDAAANPLGVGADVYNFGGLSDLQFDRTPIDSRGSLTAGVSTQVAVTALDSGQNAVAGATVYLSFTPTPGGGSADVNGTAVTGAPAPFTADKDGRLFVTYTTPAALPAAGGTDLLRAQNAASSPTVIRQDTYEFSQSATFYFSEGFTGSGFNEVLSLLMPQQNGTALIDYYLNNGTHFRGYAFLTGGQVLAGSINNIVPNQEVSIRVILPGPGVAERALHFNTGSWHGSTDVVGVPSPAAEWYFAEGSTFSAYSEFLTLQNPTSGSVSVTLNYFTDAGPRIQKKLNLPPSSRTTVVVYGGDQTNNPACTPGAGGNCGIGGGVGGVSVQVLASSGIIVERPFYVNNFNFGFGPIKDGHDAFGATGTSTVWNFAEGTTFNGFNEYLTLLNINPNDVTVELHYFTDSGQTPVKTLVVPANSRATVLVFQGDATSSGPCRAGIAGNCGVGRGIGGVSVRIISQFYPIVAERPMYMVVNYGTGNVNGAHVAVGATDFGTLFGFSAASTLSGDNDFLTIENSNSVTANVTITYYQPAGPAVRQTSVPAFTRHTVLVFGTNEGVGSGIYPLGIVVSSDQPVLVEKPTYSSNSSAYGATDAIGYSPSSF